MSHKILKSNSATASQQIKCEELGPKGQFSGRTVEYAPKTAKIQFEKILLDKRKEASEDLCGSIGITQDNNHKGILHVIIYIGQLINAFMTGMNRENINLCHSQIIIGINESEKRKGELLLAHAVLGGIKTTSENHKEDEVITGVYIYRPVDEKMRNLFLTYAKQTAVNFNTAGLDPKMKDFKTEVKKQVCQFSYSSMIASVFHRQVLKPIEKVQKHAAYAAADLLREDKFRDEKGNLASFFCTGYVMTLTQGAALISSLTEDEQKELKGKSRDEIAQYIFDRIKGNKEGDHLAATYRDNEFMQIDARNTMSYTAGDLLNRASIAQPCCTAAAA